MSKKTTVKKSVASSFIEKTVKEKKPVYWSAEWKKEVLSGKIIPWKPAHLKLIEKLNKKFSQDSEKALEQAHKIAPEYNRPTGQGLFDCVMFYRKMLENKVSGKLPEVKISK